jgi:hypothetical protein
VSTAFRLFIAGLVSFFLFMGWRISAFSLSGLPASLQAFFGIVGCFIVYYCYRGAGRMSRFALTDRDPIIGTVADILEARISETPEGTSSTANEYGAA